jgi:aromatic ring-opening dioxygenase catalytic subunit (LigB family)
MKDRTDALQRIVEELQKLLVLASGDDSHELRTKLQLAITETERELKSTLCKMN